MTAQAQPHYTAEDIRQAAEAMILGTVKSVSVLVESELDGLLLHQEAGDLVNVISLGNAQTRPDQEAA